MEMESTRVQLRPDGKKVIDVTLRRQARAPLAVFQFDDDDSSSDSDLDEPLFDNNNGEDDHSEDEQTTSGNTKETFNGNVQWDQVQELQELTNANSTLTAENRDFRQQIKALQIQLEAQAPVPGLDIDAVQDILLDKDTIEHDVRDVKIVHQAKTLRALKRALQREKQLATDANKQRKLAESGHQKLEQEVDMLQLKLQRVQARAAAEKVKTNAAQGGSQNQDQGSPTYSAGDSGSLKKLYEELKTKNAALQQELKKTQRALVREVGDDVPLEEIVGSADNTANGASRRGRAQQIVMLKAKVKKLQTKISSAKTSSTSIEAQETGTLDVDQRAQQELSGQQMQRQKLVDQLTIQRDELQENVHRLTRKYDALKARTQILDREKQETRSKFQVLIDKSRTDDALVDALQKQLETWKTKLHEARRARTADSSGKISASQDERAELERLRKTVAAHKASNPTTPSSTGMPQPSEISQYRAVAAEKERLTEVVRGLKTQLEDKDRELRAMYEQNGSTGQPPQSPSHTSSSLPPIGDESISRIPRRPASKIPLPGGKTTNVPPVPLAMMMEQQQQLKSEMETLRRTFRQSMREKDKRIAELEQLQHTDVHSAGATGEDVNSVRQELLDLQEENDFLRQEFDKLKARCEELMKSRKVDRK